MECKVNCYLCLANCNNSISFTDTNIGEELLREVLKLHFWFKFNETQTKQDFLCPTCLHKVTNFHEFYLEIRTIHYNIKEDDQDHLLNNIIVEIDIKKEEPVIVDDKILLIAGEKPIKSPIVESELESNQCDGDPTDDDDEILIRRIKKQSKKTNSRVKIKKKILPSPKREPSESLKRTKTNSKHEIDYLIKNNDKLLLHFSMICDLCSTTFKSWDDTREHYRVVHDLEGYLKCCGHKFTNFGRICEHLIWHDNSDAFKCTDCLKTFLDGTYLRKHKNDVHGKGNVYKCEHCDKRFSRERTCQWHTLRMHSKDEHKFECDKCDQKFGLEIALKQHQRIVHDQRDSRICDICAKFFKCSKSYTLHYKLVHTNEITKVQCNICGAWLKHEDMLKEHVRRQHEKTRPPEICKYCGREAPHKKALRSHVKYNHMNISFPCQICNKSFKKAKVLKEHMAIHTGDKALYTCSYCPKTFRSNANMYAHRKRAHPVEYEQSKLLGTKYNSHKEIEIIPELHT